LPETKGKKVNYSKGNYQNLSNALMALPSVKFASYEYPGIWQIELTNETWIFLGEDLGETEEGTGTSWNNHEGNLYGFVDSQDIQVVTSEFGKWAEGLEK
jgi:hypothetical protein